MNHLATMHSVTEGHTDDIIKPISTLQSAKNVKLLAVETSLLRWVVSQETTKKERVQIFPYKILCECN